MYILLLVQSGLASGKQVCITRGRQVSIGRSAKSDFSFPKDSFISGTHFLLENDQESCWITDLNSRNGTFVNGQRVQRIRLNDGDSIMAGHTIFTVQLQSDNGVLSAAEPTTWADVGDGEAEPITADGSFAAHLANAREDRLLKLLRDQFQPLYAVLDASSDKKLLSRIYNTPHFEALSDEVANTAVGQYTIHLVRLPADSPLLETLIHEGWGKKWGVYFTYSGELQGLPLHLHQLLETKTTGDEAEFRYYNPSVLRDYLQHCSSEQALRCFGPIDHFLLESETSDELLQFTRTEFGVKTQIISLIDQRHRSSRSFGATL